MGARTRVKKKAVVLLNLGGPSSPDEIAPFLFSLFYDPAILSFLNPFRYILAKLITKRRLPEARHIYAQLGGASPLLKNTLSQSLALETELGKEYKVFVAMRHAKPLTRETFSQVKDWDPDEITLLPLYPQYSTTTTESAFKAWKEEAARWEVPTRFIHSYPQLEGFMEALRDLAKLSYGRAKKYGAPQILMTAHGLPEKIIKKGDPYQKQVEETANRLTQSLGFSQKEIVLCYQSRVGPLKWIGPSLEEEVLKASQNRRPLVVIPISFVSEHSETLVELDITLRDLALKEGCPAFERVPTVGTHPLFIKGLASLLKGVSQI